jgi:hypothetical protein
MSDHSLDEVVRAARALLPELSALLGEEAEGLRRRLEDLLERAEYGEPVAGEIEALLRSRPATRDRLAELLSKAGRWETDHAEAPPGRTRGWRPSEPPGAPAVDVAAAPPEVHDDAAPSVVASEEVPAHTRSGRPDEDAPRWILSQVWDLTDPLEPRRMARAFHAGAEHAIKVRVGPIDDEWFGAEGAAPADSVGAQLPAGVEHTLAAIFFVPALGLKDRKALTLPATGPSDEVTFSLPPFRHRDRVEAWISLVFEGRHIQSARLAGFALDDPGSAPDQAAMSFQWAAIAPGLAEPGVREPFDASLWLDAGGDGITGVGVPNADAVISFGGESLDRVLNDVRVQLRGLVDAPTRFEALTSDATVDLLRALAFQGRILHELIGKELEEAVPGGTLERIQIVQTDRIDYVPLEFVYDLLTPSEDAGLCEGWIDVVREGRGRCPESNHPPARLPRQVTRVCPLGFWALSRVIERQVIKARDVRSEAFAVRVAPTSAKAQLAPVARALFAFSTRLDAAVAGQSTTVLETLKAVTNGNARVVSTWEDWESAISEEPSLLVLLSHTVEHQSVTALEIGPEEHGSRIKLIELVPEFVMAQAGDPPVVLLLGCDTAVERNEFRSFVGQFLDCGAALVVGTITPVLGEHIAPVARSLIVSISAALGGGMAARRPAAAPVSTFGDLLLDLRRTLLADGELTSLCISSFGDADWRLASVG